MLSRIALLLVFLCFSQGKTIAVESHVCAIGERVEITKIAVGRGNSVVSKVDGLVLRFADVFAPQSLNFSGAVTAFVGAKPDRYGRRFAHFFEADTWVQGAVLKQGRALVFGQGASLACLQALRKAEAMARRSKLGLWTLPKYLLMAKDLESLENYLGQFVVVSGRVVSIGDREKRLYLNFGQNWGQDFTVSVVKTGRGAFNSLEPNGLARLQGLKGRMVRVRGILEERQGPLIRLTDEAHIEYLDP